MATKPKAAEEVVEHMMPEVVSKPVPKVSIEELKHITGEEFGGAAEILTIEPGDAAGPFGYVGKQSITTDLGETITHQGLDMDGEMWRLPIQATFLRAVDQARLNAGDKFYVYRLPDQLKKRGKGAGKPMAIYGIKVIERTRVTAPAV